MAKIQVYNFAFSSEKVVSPESGEKYAQIKHHLQSKTVLNTVCWWIWMREDNRGWDFSSGGSVIMDQWFKVKVH